jgi:hypothetical protein
MDDISAVPDDAGLSYPDDAETAAAQVCATADDAPAAQEDAPEAAGGSIAAAVVAPAAAALLPSLHLTPLVVAARAGDDIEIVELLRRGASPRAVCLAIPVLARRHELPCYDTHALFEAVRARSESCVRALLAAPGIDPNQPATSVRLSALGDAAARGDADMCALLLADGRVDAGAAAGGAVAAHGALLAAMVGSVPTLAAFAQAGALPADLEAQLIQTATSNGRHEALAFLQGYFIDSTPWSSLPPFEAAICVRRTIDRVGGVDADGLIDVRTLEAVLSSLGIALSAEEADEAFVALNVVGDGRIDVSALTAWLLGDAAWKEALELAAKTGENGLAGIVLV